MIGIWHTWPKINKGHKLLLVETEGHVAGPRCSVGWRWESEWFICRPSLQGDTGALHHPAHKHRDQCPAREPHTWDLYSTTSWTSIYPGCWPPVIVPYFKSPFSIPLEPGYHRRLAAHFLSLRNAAAGPVCWRPRFLIIPERSVPTGSALQLCGSTLITGSKSSGKGPPLPPLPSPTKYTLRPPFAWYSCFLPFFFQLKINTWVKLPTLIPRPSEL